MQSNKEEQFIIKGLSGKRSLSGSIPVRGAKNVVLKALAATLLFKDEVVISNIPDIEDISRAIELLGDLGAQVNKIRDRTYSIRIPNKPKTELSSVIANKLRASIVFVGPLLVRTGKVSFPHPGGCLLGARPIDQFISGFRALGAKVSVRKLYKAGNLTYIIEAPPKGLVGAEIFFKNPSVTATETLMMTAVGAHGTTVLKNVAMEPEIVALARFLNEGGAKIEGAGTSKITIKGTGLLNGKRAFVIPPDRIEAGSFLLLGALVARDLKITDCNPLHLEALIMHLREMGVSIDVGKNFVRVRGALSLKASNIKTHEYPGFPTDLQAPMTALLTQATGRSLVFETIFEGRFRYLDALSKMGAKFEICDPHRVIVYGPTPLKGSTLMSPDLRAGLAYIIAALVAKGESVIHNVYTIDRGYERIEKRLCAIGADIKRVVS